MSQCGKKGGIPKTFHTLMKGDWSGRGNYSKWIARQWTAYKRCTSTTRKNKPCKNSKMNSFKDPGSSSCPLKGVTKKKKKKTTTEKKKTTTTQKKSTINMKDLTFRGENAPTVAWIKSRGGDTVKWKEWRKTNKKPSKTKVIEWMFKNKMSQGAIASYELWRYKKSCTERSKIPCQQLAQQIRGSYFDPKSTYYEKYNVSQSNPTHSLLNKKKLNILKVDLGEENEPTPKNQPQPGTNPITTAISAASNLASTVLDTAKGVLTGSTKTEEPMDIDVKDKGVYVDDQEVIRQLERKKTIRSKEPGLDVNDDPAPPLPYHWPGISENDLKTWFTPGNPYIGLGPWKKPPKVLYEEMSARGFNIVKGLKGFSDDNISKFGELGYRLSNGEFISTGHSDHIWLIHNERGPNEPYTLDCYPPFVMTYEEPTYPIDFDKWTAIDVEDLFDWFLDEAETIGKAPWHMSFDAIQKIWNENSKYNQLRGSITDDDVAQLEANGEYGYTYGLEDGGIQWVSTGNKTLDEKIRNSILQKQRAQGT